MKTYIEFSVNQLLVTVRLLYLICFGCLDCTISKIVTETTAAIGYGLKDFKFPMMGPECYKCKFGNSLILLAISDAKYKFIIVDAGSRGRESDGGVFARSEFGQLSLNCQVRLPPAV
ncbi:LOW QUALITY PROTEIN: putative ubiquitin carboxyl-terminal hydrolase MINDY-4 [Frankliniella fusca]|uniref:Ubiquitin carboxyl-terminal hydrolase MINDY-4 n=1 Tax=Frankliniella fusca TaxID=407009 RepID=A0AAE1LT31_9NEOP|nr:LOW QUALITY PROTEIN: putative ubiquitin carboxyl-terminal hydrolase MINDY-4 [Frankliniella fusca]